ncbi:MAG: hypothetical protein K2Q45_06875 [Nitrosomonas sp.]|nr:hypothetical protein [Nitrosomonas sp.]
MATKYLYIKLFEKNTNLENMRNFMNVKDLTLQDRKKTVCKTGLLPCVEHFWFLEHGSDGICSQQHYVKIAAKRGHASVLKFLSNRVDSSNVLDTRVYFTFVVCTLIQNNFIDLAFSVFSSERGMWWNAQAFCLFRSDEKYNCWKTAVEHGLCDLDNKMFPSFVGPEYVDRLPGTRLLIAAESFNKEVFNTYWNAMSNNKQNQREFGEHAQLNLAQLAIRGEHGLRPSLMLQYIQNKLEQIQ